MAESGHLGIVIVFAGFSDLRSSARVVPGRAEGLAPSVHMGASPAPKRGVVLKGAHCGVVAYGSA